MVNRLLRVVVVSGFVFMNAPVYLLGQTNGGTNWTAPRTPDGHADLQGIWTNNSATPMQRPEELGDKAVLTDEELAELQQTVQEFRDNEQAGDLLGDRLFQQALGNSKYNDFDTVLVTIMRFGWWSVN